jgi:hypothetical protein
MNLVLSPLALFSVLSTLCPLQLGPRHLRAETWLAAHWGAAALHQVARRDKPRPGQRLRRGHVVLGYRFFTQDRPPAPAIATLAATSPNLQFKLQSRPAEWTRGWLP